MCRMSKTIFKTNLLILVFIMLGSYVARCSEEITPQKFFRELCDGKCFLTDPHVQHLSESVGMPFCSRGVIKEFLKFQHRPAKDFILPIQVPKHYLGFEEMALDYAACRQKLEQNPKGLEHDILAQTEQLLTMAWRVFDAKPEFALKAPTLYDAGVRFFGARCTVTELLRTMDDWVECSRQLPLSEDTLVRLKVGMSILTEPKYLAQKAILETPGGAGSKKDVLDLAQKVLAHFMQPIFPASIRCQAILRRVWPHVAIPNFLGGTFFDVPELAALFWEKDQSVAGTAATTFWRCFRDFQARQKPCALYFQADRERLQESNIIPIALLGLRLSLARNASLYDALPEGPQRIYAHKKCEETIIKMMTHEDLYVRAKGYKNMAVACGEGRYGFARNLPDALSHRITQLSLKRDRLRTAGINAKMGAYIKQLKTIGALLARLPAPLPSNGSTCYACEKDWWLDVLRSEDKELQFAAYIVVVNLYRDYQNTYPSTLLAGLSNEDRAREIQSRLHEGLQSSNAYIPDWALLQLITEKMQPLGSSSLNTDFIQLFVKFWEQQSMLYWQRSMVAQKGDDPAVMSAAETSEGALSDPVGNAGAQQGADEKRRRIEDA